MIKLSDEISAALENECKNASEYLKKNVQFFNMKLDEIDKSTHKDLGKLLADRNNNLFNAHGSGVHGKNIVYVIWTKSKSAPVPLARYVGHVAGSSAVQRIRNHFFYRDPRTGSQLENVQRSLKEGLQVGISFVEIEPEHFRMHVEAYLLENLLQGQAHWMKKGKPKKRESAGGE